MLKKTLIAIAVLGAAAPTMDAMASSAARPKHQQKQVVVVRPVYRAVAPAPGDAFGAAVLGAIYGYWSDGYRTYGGDPCYVYNDRDWEFQRVC